LGDFFYKGQEPEAGIQDRGKEFGVWSMEFGGERFRRQEGVKQFGVWRKK
jgi:hypothetical protein